MAKTSAKKIEILIALTLLLLCLLLTFGRTTRELGEMNMYDEAWNIHYGRLLAEGELTKYAWGPLVSGMHALTYLVFKHSPYWFVYSGALAQQILNLATGAAGYLVARTLRGGPAYGYFAFWFMLTSQPGFLITNQSDALFAATSALALWKTLHYLRARKASDAAWASTFLGGAALSRNEGVVLFGIFLLLVLFSCFRDKTWRSLFFALLPFAALVGGYLILYGAVTGDFNPGTLARSYIAFRQGHLFVYTPDPGCSLPELECAELQTDHLYGTAEENRHSILAAIANNPGAYLHRVLVVVTRLPWLVIAAFSPGALLVLAPLTVIGLASLRRAVFPGALLLWCSYLGVYLLTFFRLGYFQSLFYLPAGLAAAGIGVMWNSGRRARLAAVGFLWAAVLFNGGVTLPDPFNPAQTPEYAVIRLMEAHLPADSLVAGGVPGPVWAARMKFLPVRTPDFSSSSTEHLLSQLQAAGVRAVYADKSLIRFSPRIWSKFEAGFGKDFEVLYADPERPLYLLLLAEPGEISGSD